MSADVVNHPAHYAEGWSNGAELIDITENLNFNRGNAVKYIARAGKKDPEKELEDLQKAEFYLQREIARIEFEDSLVSTVFPRWTISVGGGPALGMENFYLGERFGPEQMSLWDEELDDWERELLQVPRIWISLEDVPTDVRVTDKSGDEWRFDDSHGWQFRGSLTGAFFSMYSNADNHGPFTEIIKTEPRVWKSLTEVPKGQRVLGADGDPDPWLGEGPNGSTDFDTYGPFTEVVE